MESDYKKLFTYLKHEEPSDLAVSIMKGIRAARKAELTFRRNILISTSFLSLGGLVFVALNLWQSIQGSGFYEYLSLIFSSLFSGDSSMLTYWHELSATLIESAPIWGMIGFLVFLGVFTWSTFKALENNYQNYAYRT